ncbi:MAG: hypothetical protein JL50_08625 [Peptococcaceae bacterium BICA1-7]|nr:MAG: hypothetical protein JL50_08625 [Peptococcaceae bacterium BICA1-7]HBV97372.1 hypothetical protein [Desulfotomaculum sp.]
MSLDKSTNIQDETASILPSAVKRATGDEIRASLPPYIQHRIRKTQEKRKRASFNYKTGMLHGSRHKQNKMSPLAWIRSFFKDR